MHGSSWTLWSQPWEAIQHSVFSQVSEALLPTHRAQWLGTQIWEVESPGFESLQPSRCVVLGRALHVCVCVWTGKMTQAKGQGLGVAAVPG